MRKYSFENFRTRSPIGISLDSILYALRAKATQLRKNKPTKGAVIALHTPPAYFSRLPQYM